MVNKEIKDVILAQRRAKTTLKFKTQIRGSKILERR